MMLSNIPIIFVQIMLIWRHSYDKRPPPEVGDSEAGVSGHITGRNELIFLSLLSILSCWRHIYVHNLKLIVAVNKLLNRESVISIILNFNKTNLLGSDNVAFFTSIIHAYN